MKAVILEAGVSRRLYPSTKDIPKCLLPIGDSTILEYQLNALKQSGITDVVLVLGYRREQILAAAEALFPEMKFTSIINHHFFETNTAYSLWLASEEIAGQDFVFFNGDVLFSPEMVKRVVSADAVNALAVEVKRCGDEEVKVTVDADNRIVNIGKEIDPEAALGEFIGVARFGASITDEFIEALRETVEAGLNTAYFEYALKHIAASQPLTAIDVSDLPCIEVDFPEDLERAREMAAEMKPSVNEDRK